MNLTRLKKLMDNCELCCPKKRKAYFFGNQFANVLFVAQNAGAYKPQINLDNIPFNLHDWTPAASDKATGDILKDMLKGINFMIDDFAITNLVKCPIDMSERHISNCFSWLFSEIRLMPNLSLIACLGKYAGYVFHLTEFLRERQLFYDRLSVIMLHHPGYYLRNSNQLGDYRNEFRKVKAIIDERKI